MVKLRFDTDIGTTLKAAHDLASAVDKVGDSAGHTAKELTAIEKAAKRITDQNLTPQERYNKAIAAMATAVKAGKMSFDDAEKSAARLRSKLDETAGSGKKAFGAEALSDLKSFATGLLGIGAAVSLIRSELEAQKATAERIAQTQLGAAPARDVLKRNISGLGDDKATAFEARANALAAELRLPQEKVDVALAEAYSASSGDIESTFSRVRVAGQYLKTSPDQLGAFSGTLGDISKATGSSDDLANLGFMVRIGAMSRVADAKQQAKNIPQALTGAVSYGATAEEGGALFAALSGAAADPEGATTGTGVIAVAQQMAKFFDEQVKAKKFQADAVDTFGERLGELRRDPLLARSFVDKASFEKKVGGPLQSFLLDAQSPISKEYEKDLTLFGTAAEQRATGQSTIDYLSKGRLANSAEIDRTISSTIEQFDLGSQSELTADAREKIIAQQKTVTGLFDFATRAGVYSGTGPTMSPQEAIEELRVGLKMEEGNRRPWDTAPTDAIEKTNKMIETLQTIVEQQREQIEQTAAGNQGSTLTAPRPSGRQE